MNQFLVIWPCRQFLRFPMLSMGLIALSLSQASANVSIETCRVRAIVTNLELHQKSILFQLQKKKMAINTKWILEKESESLTDVFQLYKEKIENQDCVRPNVFHMDLLVKNFFADDVPLQSVAVAEEISRDTIPSFSRQSFDRMDLPNWHEIFPLSTQKKKDVLAIVLNAWHEVYQQELNPHYIVNAPLQERLLWIDRNSGFLFDLFASVEGTEDQKKFLDSFQQSLNFNLLTIDAVNLDYNQYAEKKPGHFLLKLAQQLTVRAMSLAAEDEKKKSYHYMQVLPAATLKSEQEFYRKHCFTKYIDNEGNLQDRPVKDLRHRLTFKHPLKYCLYIDPFSSSSTILYHLGGAGSTEDDPDQMAFYDLRNKYRNNKQSMPFVIAITLGKRESLIVPKRADYFVEKWSKVMEKDLNALVAKYSHRNQIEWKRMALGMSLGAASVLHVDMLYPQFFQKVASICPPVIEIDASFPLSAFREYLKESGAIPYLAIPTMFVSRLRLGPIKEFFNSVNPLVGGEALLKNIVNPFFLSVGNEDQLGLNLGVAKLHEKLVSANVPTTYLMIESQDIVVGKKQASHCVIPTSSLKQFLSNEN